MLDSEEFARRTDPYRRELLVHCYRMLGSVHDAEDLVQETYLRAWRAYGDYDDRRASLRTWLHRIATNACLTALEHTSRRLLPTGLGGPGDDPTCELVARPEVPWLQPIPDALAGAGTAEAADPATVVTTRASLRLALVAALQHLPPRQRAVLILRDVLAWRAAEVADLLGTTTAAVNSALQRARAQLDEVAPDVDEITEPAERERRELLDRYVSALENADVAALTQLLTEDAVWEMPPFADWFTGRDAIGRLVAFRAPAAGLARLLPTRANGQPAFGFYHRPEGGVYHARIVQVLTLTEAGIARVTAFHDPSLFAMFGLPDALPVGGVSRAGA